MKSKIIPLLKQIQPLYEDVYIKWLEDNGYVRSDEIMSFKDAKLKYGDYQVTSYSDIPSALVTEVVLIRKEN